MRFVGREAELEALVGVASAGSSGPALAVVIGDPGSGKSRLLEEARLRSSVSHSLSIVGYEAGRLVPLAAASGLLRTLIEVPVHGQRLDDLVFGREQAGSVEPVRVFEAAHRAFSRLEPALLVIDDLQWVDDLSYALCHYLLRAAVDSRQRLAIFAARRRGDRGADLTAGLAGVPVEVIELEPLGREDGIDLACELNADLDRQGAAELWERAQGSPFWIGALAREQRAESVAGELITARLRDAGADAAELLALLAVTGRPLGVANAAALLQWPDSRLTSALDKLVERGVAIGTGNLARVTHDLVREAALAEVSVDTRRRLHEMLAEQLERDAGEAISLLREALEHRRSAGLPTLDLATRIARSSQRRLLGEPGLRLLVDIADESSLFEPRSLALREAVASLAAELGEHKQALVQWTIVAERTDVLEHRAEALLAAAKAAYALELPADARALLDRSRELDAADDVLELEQRTHDAAIRMWLERETERGRALATAAVEEAVRLVRSRGGVTDLDGRTRRAYLDALQLESDAALQRGDGSTLLRAGEAREEAARGFDVELFLAASLNIGGALRWLGREAEALDRFRRVWDEAHRYVLPRLTVDAGHWLSITHQTLGELVDAERVLEETMDLVARVGDLPRGRHRVSRIARSVELERGGARDALRRLAHDVEAEPNEHQRINLHGDLALWHARLEGADGVAQVREHVAAGTACAESVGCPRCGAELLLMSSEALARAGERVEARHVLERWSPAGGSQVINEIGRLHSRGLVETAPAARVAALEEALRFAGESPYALASLWIRLDLGLALAEAQDERAVAELQAAAEIARDRGASTVQDFAEHAMRSLGVRTWRRSATGAPLTDREREVADLVAEGATNREIAQKLFLAPKTVERHVSNALRKLGARNRTELATRVRAPSDRDAGNAR